MVHTFQVGDYARNIESGWLGKIQSLATETVKIDDTRSYVKTMAKMIGVDELARNIGGLTTEESLSDNDIQWHSTDDLTPCVIN